MEIILSVLFNMPIIGLAAVAIVAFFAVRAAKRKTGLGQRIVAAALAGIGSALVVGVLIWLGVMVSLFVSCATGPNCL